MARTMWAAALAAATMAFGGGAAAFADEHGTANGPEAPEEPRRFEKTDTVRVGDDNVRYRVVAGDTFLRDHTDEPIASIFSIAYVRQGVDDSSTRPVTFVFNGGPGSASLWLHMGVFGPKRVVTPSDATDDGSPPYPIVDNAQSLLDVSDLVFIDPVGTGFSRVFGDQDPTAFYGVRKDAQAVGQFIRVWLSENGRWNSPKYLAGESYGTTRAGALVEELNSRYNDVAFNGVILISAILDFEAARGKLGSVGLLPTQAAIAWHHDKVDRARWNNDQDAFLDDARDFAARRLGPALMLGQSMPADEYDAVVSEFAAFTGLTETYARRANLVVTVQRYMRELLRDEGLSVGRFDGRYTGDEAHDVGETAEADPSGYAMDAAYTAAVNDYFTRDLEIELPHQYEVLSFDVNRAWDPELGRGGSTGPGFTNVVPGLARGMRQNKDMRVMLVSGIYDQATPFFAAEMSLAVAGVPQDRVVKTYYPAGHMMYLHEPSFVQMAEDVRAFIEAD